MKVGFVSLGCSKNLIDTEVAIGVFQKNNFVIVNDPKQADIIVVNTCGFIDSAKEEAVNTLLEMAEFKKENCKYLITMGCMVQRYVEELEKSIPEIDLFLRISDYDKMWQKIAELVKDDRVDNSELKNNMSKNEIRPMATEEEFLDRVVTTGKNFAYLKIGEGCSNNCTYCAIPYIRGPFVSRPKEEIIKEAKELAKKGIKEIIVIAQDTTKYGIDIYGEPKLAGILKEISKIEGIEWIRFLYSYPEDITDELIEIVANEPKIAKYFDIPIQHVSNRILKKMNRKTSKESIVKLLAKIRAEIPNVTLRTSLIVGFPSEAEKDFNELFEFIKEVKFDRLGVFAYSKEEGTPAEKLPEQIHGNTKKARQNKIMKEQQKISKEILESKKGKIETVLIENKSHDGKFWIARTMQDVPEIDGVVYVKKFKEEDVLNKFIKVQVVGVSNNYDLIAKKV